MPSIAAAARAAGASFYWHLGDLRAIYKPDQDYAQLNPGASLGEYQVAAWDDFIRSQIEPFGDMPFFVGIGNHELIEPKTRAEFALAFADWLDAPVLRQARLADDPHDHTVRTYYHWSQGGVEFINLDNATAEQFDDPQIDWLAARLDRAKHDPQVRAIVVGMHEALPDSIAATHSMGDSPVAAAAGRRVYHMLLEAQVAKPVYVLASHSHFVMQGIFATPYWREHGGVLPGWIIGTAGAVRYPLPPDAASAAFALTHVYGYLRATVSPPGERNGDPIEFEFHEVTEQEVPAALVQRYGSALVHQCYSGNPAP